jgi:hypothetical protein
MLKMSKSKADKIQELYKDYVALLERGMSPEQAISEFSYLHAITLSRLKKRIVDNSVGDVDKTESAS